MPKPYRVFQKRNIARALAVGLRPSSHSPGAKPVPTSRQLFLSFYSRVVEVFATKLKERIVVITGADSGIGQATAQLSARESADICISYQSDREGAEEAWRRVEQSGRRAVMVQGMSAS